MKIDFIHTPACKHTDTYAYFYKDFKGEKKKKRKWHTWKGQKPLKEFA